MVSQSLSEQDFTENFSKPRKQCLHVYVNYNVKAMYSRDSLIFVCF